MANIYVMVDWLLASCAKWHLCQKRRWENITSGDGDEAPLRCGTKLPENDSSETKFGSLLPIKIQQLTKTVDYYRFFIYLIQNTVTNYRRINEKGHSTVI
ncbi:hypothetical protein P2G88_06705 [Aliiglaciecola sp. CAU 1673]|uniref:hypothetical protein n=1 Tax=Aliiglaciecola sp. CAU 1673 TaxID=3032595 RepID=UPI0023DA3FC7|nr:hypothetical protein [Aliiglaciecola sp. CAU 1673]MDF2177937.1 hypothetical protein [Aliiglaciecola sp. CAU 1673]